MNSVRFSLIIPVTAPGDVESLLDPVERILVIENRTGEAVFVFDGHRGRDAAHLRELAAGREGIRVVELHQRLGESAALAAGFRDARGRYLVRLPGREQVDFKVVSRILKELETGVDCVLVERVDAATGKRTGGWQRRLHNFILSRIARSDIRDVGCQVQGFTPEVAAALPLHGSLHRYLPVLVGLEGFSTTHVQESDTAVSHPQERRSVRSYPARALDFLAVLFLARSTGSPLRFFGMLGMLPLVTGTALTLWLVVERFTLGQPLAGRPLLLLGLLLITAGIQALAIGFLSELMVYLHYRDRHPDRVRPVQPSPTEHSSTQRDGS